MKELVKQDDPNISFVFQGVQQDAHGRPFRQGLLKTGEPVMIDAKEESKYYLSSGSLSNNLLHVMVEHPGHPPKRCWERKD